MIVSSWLKVYQRGLSLARKKIGKDFRRAKGGEHLVILATFPIPDGTFLAIDLETPTALDLARVVVHVGLEAQLVNDVLGGVANDGASFVARNVVVNRFNFHAHKITESGAVVNSFFSISMLFAQFCNFN